MNKKFKKISIKVLIILGLIWGSFEILIRNFADGKKLSYIGNNFAQVQQYSLAKFFYYLAIKAGDSDAYCKLANFAKNQQNFDEEIYWYLKYYKVNDKKATIEIINTYKRHNNIDKVKEWCLKCAKNGDFRAYKDLGDIFVKVEDWPKAEKWYKKAFSEFQDFNGLFHFYSTTNQQQKLDALIKEILAQKNDYSSKNLAFHLECENNYARAIKIYQSLEINQEILKKIALCHFRNKQYQKFLNTIKKVKKHDLNDEVYYAIAKNYYGQKDYLNALPAYETALSKGSRYETNLFLDYLKCAEKTANLNAVLAFFNAYEHLDFFKMVFYDYINYEKMDIKNIIHEEKDFLYYHNAYEYFKVGKIFLALQKFELARLCFKKALKILPFKANFQLARTFHKEKKYLQAIEFYKKAIFTYPHGNPFYRYYYEYFSPNIYIGDIYYKEFKDYKKAIKYYRKAQQEGYFDSKRLRKAYLELSKQQ